MGFPGGAVVRTLNSTGWQGPLRKWDTRTTSHHLWQTTAKRDDARTSLVVQWLRHCTSTAEGVGSISGWGTKVPRVVQHDQNRKKKKKEKKCCYKNWILTNSFRAKYANLKLQEAQTQGDSAPTQFFFHDPVPHEMIMKKCEQDGFEKGP